MSKITIFILFSLVMVTLVGLSLIPQMMIPEDDDFAFSMKKTAPPERALQAPLNAADGCDAGNYGMSCNIVKYLETNLTQPVNGGRVFCAYEIIGSSDGGDTTYLNYSCEEFYVGGGKIYRGSGQAGPGKIIEADNGSLSHWVPRDGSYFPRDIQEFFPEVYREAAMAPFNEKMAQINGERAQNYFKAEFDFKVEKTTEVDCNYDFECVTPAEFMAMSRCQFTSKCITGKCAVICPNLNL